MRQGLGRRILQKIGRQEPVRVSTLREYERAIRQFTSTTRRRKSRNVVRSPVINYRLAWWILRQVWRKVSKVKITHWEVQKEIRLKRLLPGEDTLWRSCEEKNRAVCCTA